MSYYKDKRNHNKLIESKHTIRANQSSKYFNYSATRVEKLTKSGLILDLNLIGREDGVTPIIKQNYAKIVQSWITLDPLLLSWKMLPT